MILSLQIWAFHSLRHDDAFISYRYAQNLVMGRGLVFNSGERVFGSTAPGHVLLAAAVYALVGQLHLPSVMAALGCLGWLLQALAVFSLLERALGKLGAAFAGSLIAAGLAFSHRFVSLETNLVMALALWALVLALRSRWLAAGALGGLAILFRADAVLLLLPIAVPAIRLLGRRVWRPLAVAVAIVLPWFAFAWGYFGSPIPNSVATKAGSVALDIQAFRILGHAVAPLTGRVPPVWSWNSPPGALAWIAWGLVLVGAFLLVRRDRRLWILTAAAALNASFYLVMRAGVGVEWHIYPLMLLGSLFAAATVFELARLVGKRWGYFLLVLPLVAITYRTATYAASHEHAYWFGARDEAYRQIAGFLAAHDTPGQPVAAGEVGTLAYYSDRKMADLGYLVSRPPWPVAQERWRWRVRVFDWEPPGHVVFQAVSGPVDNRELHPQGAQAFVAEVIDDAAPETPAADGSAGP